MHQTADCPARIKPISDESNTYNTGVIARGNAGRFQSTSLHLLRLPTKAVTLTMYTAPSPSTEVIRFLIRSIRSIRISKIVDACVVRLTRTATAARAGSYIFEIRMKNGLKRIERRRQNSHDSLLIAREQRRPIFDWKRQGRATLPLPGLFPRRSPCVLIQGSGSQ